MMKTKRILALALCIVLLAGVLPLTAAASSGTLHSSGNFYYTISGGEVTVTGLLTGRDLAQQLKDKPLGDTLYLARTTLRAEGDLFLCGMTPAELGEKLGTAIDFVENDGAELVEKIVLGTSCN